MPSITGLHIYYFLDDGTYARLFYETVHMTRQSETHRRVLYCPSFFRDSKSFSIFNPVIEKPTQKSCLFRIFIFTFRCILYCSTRTSSKPQFFYHKKTIASKDRSKVLKTIRHNQSDSVNEHFTFNLS